MRNTYKLHKQTTATVHHAYMRSIVLTFISPGTSKCLNSCIYPQSERWYKHFINKLIVYCVKRSIGLAFMTFIFDKLVVLVDAVVV